MTAVIPYKFLQFSSSATLSGHLRYELWRRLIETNFPQSENPQDPLGWVQKMILTCRNMGQMWWWYRPRFRIYLKNLRARYEEILDRCPIAYTFSRILVILDSPERGSLTAKLIYINISTHFRIEQRSNKAGRTRLEMIHNFFWVSTEDLPSSKNVFTTNERFVPDQDLFTINCMLRVKQRDKESSATPITVRWFL